MNRVASPNRGYGRSSGGDKMPIGIASSGEHDFSFKDWKDASLPKTGLSTGNNAVTTTMLPPRGAHNDGDSTASTQVNGHSASNSLGTSNGTGTGTGTGNANSTSGSQVAGLPDFFSQEVFNIVLHNPTTSHQLHKFSHSRFCSENMEFLEKVDRYNDLLDELTKVMSDIYRSFTSPEATRQLNISSPLLKRINMDIKSTQTTTLPALELVFGDAQACVENILATDIYPRFVKHQMALSAAKALAKDRERYAGLGDCFCITDCSIADLPITSASDGFVKVTGFTRGEIVPRNCRFLQGKYTDQAASKRIKEAILAQQESVELLLNYKKNGTPFWNLLYCAPLFNSAGECVYFLGGQINVSHTVHSRSDILRVLSASDEPDPEPEELADKRNARQDNEPRRRLFRRLKSQSRQSADMQARNVGMERDLLQKIEKMNFQSQMKMFYAAYSKYLVLGPDFDIQFFSNGVIEMLLIDPSVDTTFVGSDIFKILTQYSYNLPRDFKPRVKSSIQSGRALSIDINLATRRSMLTRGHDRFATHWTPLKDEHQAVQWIVICFAPYNEAPAQQSAPQQRS